MELQKTDSRQRSCSQCTPHQYDMSWLC